MKNFIFVNIHTRGVRRPGNGISGHTSVGRRKDGQIWQGFPKISDSATRMSGWGFELQIPTHVPEIIMYSR